MRPVRFVALSEDGHALVLADELGRLLALPLDERVSAAVDVPDGGDSLKAKGESPSAAKQSGAGQRSAPPRGATHLNLSPRDIQTRIRSGESAEDIAASAQVAVDRVLRYAGPVLQERAMLAQAARRARLATSERGDRMSNVVDMKLGAHGVDPEAVSWDAWRTEDGSWMVHASWSSGKTTARARWKLDRARQAVTPDDEMAQFLSTPAPKQVPDPMDMPSDLGIRPGEPARPSRDPMHGLSEEDRDGPDPLRRDRLREVLERPLDEPSGRQKQHAAQLGLPGTTVSEQRETPEVPSLAVLRPGKRSSAEDDLQSPPLAAAGSKPRNQLPGWDDVLFGGAGKK
ncbi:septation protein SepH [Glycomyces sp. L485]|uniref:septation protein SepH n=1 Tax=Glycomyces sp. L485 TaxID=2909235 RepID=UPI001F4AE187|nr:septation protein SepH [Glycomyces sp. L485]MCH7232073.1 septation protein SepH [Glycomyces sp. L485]